MLTYQRSSASALRISIAPKDAAAPLLIAYPFVQKHFVRGVMIGALKG